MYIYIYCTCILSIEVSIYPYLSIFLPIYIHIMGIWYMTRGLQGIPPWYPFAVRVAAWKPAPSRSSPSSWKLTTAWNGTETGRGPQETVWRWEKMGKRMGKCRENHGIHGKTWKPTGKWGKYWKKLGQIRKHLENMWRWCKWYGMNFWIESKNIWSKQNQIRMDLFKVKL